ncbi:MAG: translation initiation factor IF-2 subunit beta [Nanoarchaeota archaeon]|nr:translation initiation factor IF-2 subunit beta [Nanoarchaeota archaeon]
MKYENLLDNVYKSLPNTKSSGERFEIPKVIGHIQGNKTIITNFTKIADTLRRPHHQFMKYLLRELATPGVLDGQRLILGRKIFSNLINAKIEQFVNEFVLCPDCKKPDTVLKKEDRILIMKCMACGAKRPIKSKI